jgi:uncharacterized protein (DUF1810 family)
METDSLNDPYNLRRFVDAQDPLYDAVCRELSAGRKQSHWMWFVFPQILGLGRSEMARRYAISGVDEARAYAAHPVLGRRLRHVCALVLKAPAGSAADIFGPLDAVKFRSSMTLFTRAAPDEPVFRACLDHFFHGQADPLTLSLL